MSNVTPTDEKYVYDGRINISQTDLDGKIIYVNNMFCELSGYSRDEIIGNTHAIVRHPSMPKAVFAKMWEHLKGGRTWNGLVKNLRKDGAYYWMDLEIIPTRDDKTNEITGYISVGKPASSKDIAENEELYAKMLEAE